jgi:hypothetical protein
MKNSEDVIMEIKAAQVKVFGELLDKLLSSEIAWFGVDGLIEYSAAAHEIPHCELRPGDILLGHDNLIALGHVKHPSPDETFAIAACLIPTTQIPVQKRVSGGMMANLILGGRQILLTNADKEPPQRVSRITVRFPKHGFALDFIGGEECTCANLVTAQAEAGRG